jgi:hypothetical protein
LTGCEVCDTWYMVYIRLLALVIYLMWIIISGGANNGFSQTNN